VKRAQWLRTGAAILFALGALGLLCLVVWARTSSTTAVFAWGTPGTYDFVEYWAAAQLWLQGENPYDLAALLRVERAVGWPEDAPLPMYNPPWTLPLLLTIAPFPFGLAALIWLVLGSTWLMVASRLLWNVQVSSDRSYRTALLLILGFTPALVALHNGQISPWLLLGVAMALYGVQRNRDIMAGVGLALLMIKPHITYLFWPVALWWALRERRVGIVVGWVAALIVGSGLALLWAPVVFSHYFATMVTSAPPYAAPTLGTWLQLLVDPRQHQPWLQLLPSLLAGLGLLIWLWRRRGRWQWPDLSLPLLLVSVPTAVYGWSFDFVVLLPVVLKLIAGTRTTPDARRIVVLGALVVLQLTLLVQNRLRVNDVFSVWYPLALGTLYVWTHLRCRGESILGVGAQAGAT